MKKRILTLVLTLCMIDSLLVPPIYATGADNASVTPLTNACPCGCGKALEAVDWKPYSGTASHGHYYLDRDLTQSTEQIVISGMSMVLDLRGHTITTESRSRLFLVSGYLAVLDSVGGGRLSARTPKTTGDYGGVVRIVDNETTGSAFELFSGTITPASAEESARWGGLVSVGSGGTFRMHDGMLLDGHAVGNGGGVLVEADTATAEILGGSVVGCQASANGGSIYNFGTVTLKNCRILNGKASTAGGNIYCEGGSLTIENSVIASGIAFSSTTGGGNISNISGTKITIKDSVIRDGFSSGYGGNLNLGYGTHTITSTQVYGGVSGLAGTNMALSHTSAKVTLTDCTVDGGVGRVLGSLTLKGATKISLAQGGLNLTAQTEKATIATGLTAGAEVYVQGTKTLTGSLDYIKPAYRTTLSADGDTITVAKAADGETAGYCPHCSQQAAWQPYGAEGATHVYLTADITEFQEFSVTGDLAIDLVGFDITAPGRAFNIAADATLAVMDSAGAGVITGSGVNGENGGIFTNAGALKLYGGKYVYAVAEGVAPTGGGIIFNSKNLYIYSGYLAADNFVTAEGATTCGGAIRMAEGATATLNMDGGRVVGGSATQGGCAYFNYNNIVTIRGATFTGGTAQRGGGNICCGSTADNVTLTKNNKGKLTMTDASVTAGEATTQYAGNVHLDRWGAEITNCYLSGGTTKEYGGNLSVGICPSGIAVNDSILTNGSSQNRGGNFYTANNSSVITVASLTNCVITNGSAVSGGNLYIYHGKITIAGGEISHGTSSGSGGNIYARTPAGITFVKNESGAAPRILCGEAGSYGGNLYAQSTITLTDAFISGGSAATMGPDIYAANATTSLTFGSGVAGEIHMDAGADLHVADEIGTNLDKVTAATFPAKLYLGEVGVILNGETLYAGATAVIDKNGNDTWYYNNSAAADACAPGSYVKLYTSNDLVLTKDLYVDLNGKNITVSGDYAFYGMDSSGDAYATPTGSVIGVAAQTFDSVNAPNGNQYIAVNNGESVSYHRLDLAITGVSIRPTANGMYYSAKWSCDDTLKGMIDAYGVVASVADMPGTDFADDDANLYTAFDQASFQSGAVKKGAVIEDVMLAGSANDINGKTTVYAKAYIRFVDGPAYISDDNIGYSLYDVMKNLDRLITEKPIRYRKYNLSARNFYQQWKDDGMGDWDLKKIPAPTEDDGVIDLLMVGHSFCYYYVEELYALAKAAGISMRVCNLYYSSRGIQTHYEKWQDGVADYQLFEISDDTGGVRKSSSSMSLEHALSKYEWDFIALQGGTAGAVDSGEAYYQEVGAYSDALLAYFLQEFPNARIGWHQAWTNQAGEYRKTGSTMTTEKQISGAEQIQIYAELVCGHFNEPAGETLVQRIPTGMAWQNCRTADGYDYLCSRLGYDNNEAKLMHAGDGNHDGDIGGGQYLNACVWFEVITGISVLGNPYRPEYATSSTLSTTLFNKLRVTKTTKGYALTEEFVLQLQQYAHAAVAELNLFITDGNYQ